jgi:xanthine dehydrogenase accessory factor
MIAARLSRRADELRAARTPFVVATVVRAQRPTSVHTGDAALVLGDGTIEGFVGGTCAEQSVRLHALRALETGEALLLRILPGDGEALESDPPARVTVQNMCLSGGSLEIFIEPMLASPRVLVVGETPIASAVARMGAELDLDMVVVPGADVEPAPDDLALVVAAHGRDELSALRRGLEAGLPYVGLVASVKRGTGVLAELRGDGVPDRLLARIDVPAGLDIGARSPAEIALSILAKIISVRHDPLQHAPLVAEAAVATPELAVDPICGMTVAATPDTPSLTVNGETIYFCCDGCKAKFEAQQEHAHVSE